MANPNIARGFSPVGTLAGTGPVQPPRMYCIPSTDTNQYAIGDVVKSLAGSDTVGVPYVVLAGNTDTPRGVIVGIVVAPTLQGNPVPSFVPNLNTYQIPATKLSAYYVLVLDDPMATYEVQANNSGTLVTTVIGKNCNMATAVPGTYLSGTVLGTGATGGSAATTSTLQWKILGLMQRPGADFTANAPLLVVANIHELKSVGTAGV